jgi:hypothetical protein
MASFAIKVIRNALKGVDAFSPEAAGRLAFRLFTLTPGRRPKNAKERAALAAAAPVIARGQPVTLSYAGGWVLARKFAAPREAANTKRILLVHGWGSRSDYLSAMIDGLGRGGALLRITLPLAMPGVVTAMIFTFIAAWNEFVMGLTLSTVPESQPLTVGINSFIGNYTVQWNYLFAGSVIAIVPVVILFALIERKVVSGLTAGSVK